MELKGAEGTYRMRFTSIPPELVMRFAKHLLDLLVDHEIGGNKMHALVIVQPVGYTFQILDVGRPEPLDQVSYFPDLER